MSIHPKKTKALIQKDTGILMFMATLFTLAENWEHPKCPSTDEWIKMICIYIYIYIYNIFFRVKKDNSKAK